MDCLEENLNPTSVHCSGHLSMDTEHGGKTIMAPRSGSERINPKKEGKKKRGGGGSKRKRDVNSRTLFVEQLP